MALRRVTVQIETSHMAATGTDSEARPLLHCYFREHLFMTTREAADIRARTPAYDDRRVRMQKASMDTVTVETNLDFLLA